ncbi:MAG: tetratricopeptide repeat protein [Rikenellaceae bacterium]
MHKQVYIIFALLITTVTRVCAVNSSAEERLVRAKDLYEFGNWGDAKIELLKAKGNVNASNSALNREIDYYIALCSVEMGDKDAAFRLFEFEENYGANSYSNNVRFNKAISLYQAEDFAAAAKEFKLIDYAQLNAQERERLDIRMAYITFNKGEYEDTLSYLNRIPQQSDFYDDALYFRSYISYINSDIQAAKEGFTSLTSTKTYGKIVRYYLLQIESRLGNYDYVVKNGESLFHDAGAEQKEGVARTICEAYFQQGDYKNALKYFDIYRREVKELSRQDNYIGGFSFYRTGEFDVALRMLREVCGVDDELTQNASFHLADCYIKKGDKESAMHAFAMASNEAFNGEIAEDALFNYAKLRYDLGEGKFNETINTLTRYIKKYPNSERVKDAKILLVASYYNSKNYEAAYQAIKEAENPDAELRAALQKITYFRAVTAFNAGDYTKASASFKESLKVGVSPKYNALAHFWLGEIAYMDGEFTVALDNYNSYIARAPKTESTYVMAQYSTAYALMELGRDDSAVDYFNRFITLLNGREPEMVIDAQNRIGDIYYSKRLFDNATKYYNRSARSTAGAGHHYAEYQMAIIKGVEQQYNQKISRLQGIIKRGEGDYVDKAMYELAKTYIVQGDYAQASKSLEEYIVYYPESDNRAEVLTDLALSHLNLGDRSKALSYYEQAIKAAPQSLIAKDATQGIRDIYIDQGDANGYFDYAKKMGLESDLDSVAKDSLSFVAAQRMYLTHEQPSKVQNSLSEYVENYPRGYYLTDVLFMLSDSYIKTGDTQQAIKSLQQLTALGLNQYSERVYTSLSRLTYKGGMYGEAAKAYRTLYDISKNAATRQEAMTNYTKATIATGDRGAIMAMADDVLSQKDAGAEAVTAAKYSKATILRKDGSWQEAIALYQDLAKDPLSDVGAESTYYVIENSYRADKGEQTKDMIFKFAQSNTTHSYWLAKAFIILGDIYVAEGDNFQARATLQSVVDGYSDSGDGIIEEAKGKIDKLK